MPAIFTNERKKRIYQSLIENGIEFFGKYGVKKTTIDEITVKSSIAKGSFYTFFPSKEHLLLHCLIRVRERIAKELTAPILETAGTPEESIAKLLQAGPELPVMYPVIKECYKPGIQKELLQIAGELHIDKREFTPVPNFGAVAAHWKYQGYTIDVEPRELEQAVEFLSSHTAVMGYAEFRKGIDILMEFSAIGCAGFVREVLSQ